MCAGSFLPVFLIIFQLSIGSAPSFSHVVFLFPSVGAAVAVPIGAAVAAATVLESKVGANRAVENTAAAVSRAVGVGTGGVADRAASRLDAIGETMNGAVQRSLDAGAKVVSKVPGWGALARMTRMGGRK